MSLIKIIGDLGISIIAPKTFSAADVLTRSMKRRMSQGKIRRLLSLGKGTAEIADWLKNKGLAYTRKYMETDIRRLAMERLRIGTFKVIDMKKPIPSEFLRVWTGYSNARYRSLVRYRVQDARGKWGEDRWITVFSRRKPTGEQIIEAAKVKLARGPEGDGYGIQKSSRTVAFSGIEVYKAEHVRRRK